MIRKVIGKLFNFSEEDYKPVVYGEGTFTWNHGIGVKLSPKKGDWSRKEQHQLIQDVFGFIRKKKNCRLEAFPEVDDGW